MGDDQPWSQYTPGDLGQNHQLPQAWHSCCSESKGRWLRSSHSTAFPEALLRNLVKNHNHVASAGRQTWPEPEGEDVSTLPGGRLQGWCEQQPFPGMHLHQGFRKSTSAQDANPGVIQQPLLCLPGGRWMRVFCPIGFQDRPGFFTDRLCSVWSHWWGWGGRSGRPSVSGCLHAPVVPTQPWHQRCPRHSIPQRAPLHRPVAHSPEAGDSTPASLLGSRGLWHSQPREALLPARAAGATLCPSDLTRLQLLKENIQGPSDEVTSKPTCSSAELPRQSDKDLQSSILEAARWQGGGRAVTKRKINHRSSGQGACPVTRWMKGFLGPPEFFSFTIHCNKWSDEVSGC